MLVFVCILLALPKFKKLQAYTDDLNRVTRENLTGLNVVRAYNAEHYQEAKFDQANENLTSANLFANRTMAFMMPGIQAVMNGLTLAIYWIGAILINSARMASKLTLFSDMVVFSSYAMQVVMAFMMLVMIFIILPRASVSAKRTMDVLETKVRVTDSANAVVNGYCTGEVEFRNVSFRYPDAATNVVEHISFTAKRDRR